MQKHRRFEEKIEFLEATGRRAGTRYALDAIEDVLNGSAGCGGPEDNFVGTLEAKTDDIAILQLAPVDLFSAHVEAAAVAPVFKIVAPALGNNRGALAGDAAVVQLEVVSGYAAAPDEKR
jgi:hypothetical protein